MGRSWPLRFGLVLGVLVAFLAVWTSGALANTGVADSWTQITDPATCSQFGELVPCYRWNNDGGNLTTEVISQDSYQELENQLVASADEATGLTAPADIAASDAAAGASIWDRLSSAGSDLKNAALDVLDADVGVDLFASAPTLLFGGATIAGSFLLGYKVIGPAIANLLGQSPAYTGGTYNGYLMTGLRPIKDGTNLYNYLGNPIGSGFCGTTVPCTKAAGEDFVVHTNGFLVMNGLNGTNANGYGYAGICEPGPDATLTPPNVVSSAHEYFLGSQAGQCTDPSYTTDYYAWFVPEQVKNLPGPGQGGVSSGLDSSCAAYTLSATHPGCMLQSSTPAPTEAAQRAAADKQLTSPTEVTAPFNAFVCTVPAAACYGQWALGTGTVTLPAITPGETYQQWSDAARAAGLLGTITKNVLSDAAADPATQPNAVARTNPRSGTHVDPFTSVAVYVNPDSAPDPGTETGGGGGTGSGVDSPPPTLPDPPGIAVSGAPTPCNVFPFGIPCWIGNQLSALTAPAEAPKFSIGLPLNQQLTVDLGDVFGANLGDIMAVVRPLLLFLATLGIVLWLGGMAMGGSTGGGGSSGAAEAED